MLEMLCALPAPCGGEEIAKKYIMQKFPQFKEDKIGNLVAHYPGEGKTVMLYAALDEDAAVVMDVQDNKKVYFAHLGKKKVYPGMQVSFGGYTGFVCADGENPEENQYILMTEAAEGLQAGRNGVFEGNFEGETENPENVLLGKNIAARAAISAFLSDFESDFDVYIVLGVQSNHGNKGLSAAVKEIEADRVLIFEETKGEKMTVKSLTNGYAASNATESELCSAFEKAEIPYEISADSDEKSAGAAAPWGSTGVIGIPVLFPDFMRQGMYVKTADAVQKFVKTYLENKE